MTNALFSNFSIGLTLSLTNVSKTELPKLNLDEYEFRDKILRASVLMRGGKNQMELSFFERQDATLRECRNQRE